MEGTEQAVKKLIIEKRKQNGHLIISRNGKIVKVKAKDIEV